MREFYSRNDSLDKIIYDKEKNSTLVRRFYLIETPKRSRPKSKQDYSRVVKEVIAVKEPAGKIHFLQKRIASDLHGPGPRGMEMMRKDRWTQHSLIHTPSIKVKVYRDLGDLMEECIDLFF